MDLEMKLTPNHLRRDIYGTGTRYGVYPQKVQHKYGSGDWSGDGLDTLQNQLRLDVGGTRDGSRYGVDSTPQSAQVR